MNRHRTARAAAALAAATLALTSCAGIPAHPTAEAPQSPREPATAAAPGPARETPAGDAAAAAKALAALAAIPAKGRAPKTGYEREKFGPAWKDVDRNGCDTRNDTLRRDLTGIQVKPGTNGCVVLSGQLADAYTGQAVDFTRGSGPGVDIDHLVPLSDAWQKGAQGWDQDKRERFANDPANLAATSASVNRSKGDADLATWLPPARPHWCAYASGIVTVKANHGVWMTPAEHQRATEILIDCTKS
ncbi:HNH endonuclease family protein [Arthrobacter sp. MAHUQ-56]